MSVTVAHTEDELNAALLESERELVIVKFGAEWCKPCNELQPHIETLVLELQETGRGGKFVIVEKTEDTEELFEKYEITRLPTILLIKANDTKDTLSRPHPEELRTKILSHLPPPPLFLDADF